MRDSTQFALPKEMVQFLRKENDSCPNGFAIRDEL